MSKARDFWITLVVLVASVFVLGLFWGSKALAAEPPVLHIGPPATWQGVECRRATLRDLTKTPPRVLIVELCYRTQVQRGLWDVR